MGLQDQIPLSPLSLELSLTILYSLPHTRPKWEQKDPQCRVYRSPKHKPHHPIKTWHMSKICLSDPRSSGPVKSARPDKPQKKGCPGHGPRNGNLPARPDQLKMLVRTRNSLTTKNTKTRPDQPKTLVRTTAEKNDRFEQKQPNTPKLKLRLQDTQKWPETVTKHI